MATDSTGTRVGVYVDVANIAMNGGYGMRYDVLREFACRGSAEPVRLNAYVTFDHKRAESDPPYRDSQQAFFFALRDFGYKASEKTVKWYTDDSGNRYAKANTDLDMAVDALLQSENLDRVVLATGDGDFVRVVQALQNKGCRVEILAFDNVSTDLRREADMFISGYLIPNLLPIEQTVGKQWGDLGSRVRGVCYNHGKGFGFLRVMKEINSELWRVDHRHAGSPYESVFFHDSQLPTGVQWHELPSRSIVFEFELEASTVKEGSYQAKNMVLASAKQR